MNGLLRTDGTRKPAFTGLANTLAALEDSESASGSLGFGIVCRSNCHSPIRHVLLPLRPCQQDRRERRQNACAGPTAYGDHALLIVRVDGTEVGRVWVTDTSWAEYTVPASITAGAHTIGLYYANDFENAICNRNLHLDHVNAWG